MTTPLGHPPHRRPKGPTVVFTMGGVAVTAGIVLMVIGAVTFGG